MADDQRHRWDFKIGAAIADESGSIDTVRTFDPKLGYWYDKPLRGEPFEDINGHVWPSQWHHDRHIADLKRGVEACEHRLAHLDDPTPWWMGEAPTSEQVERRRAEIESEKAAALAAIERLEPKASPARLGKRRRPAP
jgi:hypothetical protein